MKTEKIGVQKCLKMLKKLEHLKSVWGYFFFGKKFRENFKLKWHKNSENLNIKKFRD